jgi:hypothetical protein
MGTRMHSYHYLIETLSFFTTILRYFLQNLYDLPRPVRHTLQRPDG